MNKFLISIVSISCASALIATTAFAATPASKQWVLQQIALNKRVLTAADWQAVCTAGTATSAAGCYGNVSSAAFKRVSDRLGGFTTLANINPANVASSIYIKSFFGGTNIPAQNGANYGALNLTVINSAARCALFTEQGQGLGIPGVSTTNPTGGTSQGITPNGTGIVSINSAATTDDLYFNGQETPLSPVGGPPASEALYMLCAGYNPANGSTAAAITVTAT